MSDEFDTVEEGSPVVRYSAKELFAQISRKLDVVLELAQSKASQAEVDALVMTVDGHDSRIQSLEDRTTNIRETLRVVAWTIGTTIALAGLVIAYYATGGHL